MKKTKKPFFAKFLENQIAKDSQENATGGCYVTMKHPSDNDESGPIVTMKYPSDGDEENFPIVTMKYPSDNDEGTTM